MVFQEVREVPFRRSPGAASREAKFAGSGGRQIPCVSLYTNLSNRSRFGSRKAPGRFGPFSGPSGGRPQRDLSGTSKRHTRLDLRTGERRHEEEEEEEEEQEQEEEEEEKTNPGRYYLAKHPRNK